MGLKQRLQRQLAAARRLTENLLDCLQTPEQWTHQVHPQANHPLWIMGHLGHTDNFMLSLVAPDAVETRPGYQEYFGLGSQPTADASQYPPIEEVRDYFHRSRQRLLEALEGFSEEDLAHPLPAGTPDFLSDRGSAFEMTIWHEGMHAGQLTVARRALGHPPLMQS